MLRGSQGQPSKFELAHGGTLHLEEIDALPLEMQGALLRVIDTGEVMRLGGSRVIPVDVRFIVSATIESGAARHQRRIPGRFVLRPQPHLAFTCRRCAIGWPICR